MCGRFTLTTNDYHAVAAALEAEVEAEDAHAYRSRFNVAPGDPHWAVVASVRGRRMRPASWGLPGPAGNPAPSPTGHINARAETLHVRPAFVEALHERRCIVPADGFYEWTGPKDHRLPIWFHPADGILAFAGLWGEYVDDHTGEVTMRFTIVTTAANDRVAPVHDRMPVILAADARAAWLDPTTTVDAAQALLRPAPAALLEATEVSARVNRVANDDAACIVPTPHPRQQTLF